MCIVANRLSSFILLVSNTMYELLVMCAQRTVELAEKVTENYVWDPDLTVRTSGFYGIVKDEMFAVFVLCLRNLSSKQINNEFARVCCKWCY